MFTKCNPAFVAGWQKISDKNFFMRLSKTKDLENVMIDETAFGHINTPQE